MEKMKNFAGRVVAGGSMAAAGIGSALATPSAFDPADVTSQITTYLGYGVVILGAMAVAVWTLRVFGLIGGRR